MTTPVPASDPASHLQPRPLSPWSLVSLVLLVPALLAAGATGWLLAGSSTGPADAAVRTFGIGVAFLASWSCALLGTLAGCAGMRGRPRSRLSRVTLALNAALVTLGLVCVALVQR
jgi:hypothetical protein